MADLFTRLARRTLGLMPVVQPRIASRFAPEETMASENASLEIPSLFEGDRSLAPREQTAPTLFSKESELREREQESITKTILVEIERESPEKQELTSEESNIFQDRKKAQEEERRNRKKKAIKPTKNELTNTEFQLGIRAENQEFAGREKIRERSGGIELEGIQRVERNSEDVREDVREKEESLVERVTKERREVGKRREVEEISRETPGAIASQEGEEKSSAKSLQIASQTESRTESYRSNNREEVTSGDVASRKVKSSAVESVRELESPDPNNREVKELGRNDRRDSPTEDVLKSVQETRESGQKVGSREWESRGNELNSGEIEESANSERRSPKTPPKTLTAKLFSRNEEKSRESVRETAPSDPVTEEKVDSPKVKSLEVERGIESESPLKSRGAKERDSKASAEGFSRQNTSLVQSRKAISFETRRKVQSENQLTAPEFPSQESETSRPLLEQEKLSALKGIEDRVKFSSRREEQLSQFAPETGIEITEKGGKTGKTETDKPVKLEDDRTGNNPLQLLDSKLAEERKASVASTPTIEVTIGKIEVRGTKPAVKPVQQSRRMQSTVSSPKLSLDEYLKQRNGRKI